ncbi:hypothetical protein ACHAPS_001016 [Verticillium nonalfalfae]
MDGSTSSRSSDNMDTDMSGAPDDRSGTGPDTLGEVHLSSGSATGVAATAAKRSRVLLSCAACRVSKLKCDRSSPCGQCIRKGRPEACQYAPKPQRRKPNQSMASRLKRLEGMVRSMLEDGDVVVDPSQGPAEAAPPLPPSVRVAKGLRASGQVVHGERGSTYIGATHFMAMLEDYREFWLDPSGIDYHWLAQLFMVICLATHFSTYTAPHELAQDSPEPPFEKMKRFRSTAAWCLVKGKYHQPTEQTIASFLIVFAES